MASLIDKAKEMVADKFAHMEKPSADLTSVGIKNCDRDSVNLKSVLKVTNPYDHDLPICEITYRLRSNDREITSGTITDKDLWLLTLTRPWISFLKCLTNFLLNLMRDIGSDWDIDYDFDVGLMVHLPIIGNFTIPLHKKGILKLPTLADLL